MPCVTKMSLQLLLPLPPPPLASAPATADGAIATAIAAVTVVAAVNAAVAADAPRCPLPHLPLPPLTQVLPAPLAAAVALETVYCKHQGRRERGRRGGGVAARANRTASILHAFMEKFSDGTADAAAKEFDM